jgi:hypothetical protein
MEKNEVRIVKPDQGNKTDGRKFYFDYIYYIECDFFFS